MKTWTGLVILFILLLSACSTPTPTPASPAQLPSPSAMPPTWTPLPMPTETPLPSPTPYQPFEAKALTDFLNLRANPGYLFKVEQMLAKDTVFKVVARSPGGEWFYVELADGKTGWLFGKLINTDKDLQVVPLREPQDVQLITGSVKMEDGRPVNGIQFMIQGAGASSPRTDALTDDTGTFYAYLPSTSTGKWYVSFTAIACTSITMDQDCNCLNGVCGSIDPAVKNVTLPQTEPLEFLWK
jgi:hypothetical protein